MDLQLTTGCPPEENLCSLRGTQRHHVHAAAVCFLLLLGVLLVFGRTTGYEFVGYDDDLYVYQNRQVARGLTAHGVAWAFTTRHAGNWHPLTWLSHMLDVQIYGLHPGGHHLTNVLLHAASVILLFLLLWRMTGFLWRSAFVAAVFAVHPLRAESVAWVAERKDVLSGLFFMLTIWAYVAYARRPFSWGRYLMVAGLFALGLMSKPMLVTLPFVLLLLDSWPLGRMAPGMGVDPAPGRMMGSRFIPDCLRKNRRVIIEKIPLLVLAAASCAATYFAQGRAVVPVDIIPIASRIANALVSYTAYIGKLFCPVGLAVLYPYPGNGFPAWQVVLAALSLAGISTATLLWRRRFPYWFVGWFWYLGMLVPVIGLVQVGSQSMADRYTYLPQIGLVLAVTWGIAQWTASRRHCAWICSIVSVILVFILTGLSWRQVSYWQNSETLWTHTLKCTAGNYKAHYNLGVALAGRGEFDRAIAHYRNSLEIKPRFAAAYNNLGYALEHSGRIDAAIAYYRMALDVDPDYAEAYNNLGITLAGRGQGDAAIALYRKAVEIKPDYAEAYNNLGAVLFESGRIDAAVAVYRKAIEIRPDYAGAYFNLGISLASLGRIDESVAYIRKAIEIRPDYVEAHNNLGIILANRGRIDEAVNHFQKALEIKPDDAKARYNLDQALRLRRQVR